jgi:hypothetical protein
MEEEEEEEEEEEDGSAGKENRQYLGVRPVRQGRGPKSIKDALTAPTTSHCKRRILGMAAARSHAAP